MLGNHAGVIVDERLYALRNEKQSLRLFNELLKQSSYWRQGDNNYLAKIARRKWFFSVTRTPTDRNRSFPELVSRQQRVSWVTHHRCALAYRLTNLCFLRESFVRLFTRVSFR